MITEIAELYDEAVAREACRRFGFRHWKSLGGFESYVYECRRDGQRYILKITHTLRRTPDYIRGELEFVGCLADRGVPTSSAVESRPGELVEAIDATRGQFLAYAFEKSSGRSIGASDWGPELFSDWGRLMGRMHSLSKDFRPSDQRFRRQQWHEEDTLRIERYVPASETALHEKAAALFARLHALPRDRDSYGLTHGDLHHRNILLDGSDIHPYDFDDCEYSWFASDIAIALYYAAGLDSDTVLAPWTDMDRRSFCAHFLNHFMSGYRTENSLDPQWLRQVPDFLRLRALIMYVIGLQHLDVDRLTGSERAQLAFHRDAVVHDAWAELSLG